MRDRDYYRLMKKAATRAKAQPVTPARCRDGRFVEYKSFCSLAAHAQILRGSQPIYFPLAATAEINLPQYLKTYRDIAEREGYLTLIEEQRGPRAARYRCNLDRFPELQEVID